MLLGGINGSPCICSPLNEGLWISGSTFVLFSKLGKSPIVRIIHWQVYSPPCNFTPLYWYYCYYIGWFDHLYYYSIQFSNNVFKPVCTLPSSFKSSKTPVHSYSIITSSIQESVWGANGFIVSILKSINIIRLLLWLQVELWYQLPADTTEKEWLKKTKKERRKRHNNTTEIQQTVRSSETEWVVTVQTKKKKKIF